MPVTPTQSTIKADTSSRVRNLEVTGALEVDGTALIAGQVTASGGVVNPLQVIPGDGAITVRNGSVVLTKATAANITLAAPTASQAGMVIIVLSTSAAAHTITGPFNAAGTTATFTAVALNRVTLLAYNLRWWVIDSLNVNIT